MPVKSKGGTGREWRWVEWIRKLEGQPPRSAFPLGIGDDAAVWKPSRGMSVVLTVDAQVEGVHFRREWMTPREIGERAVSSSVSDLAAMAAAPVALLVSVVTPRSTRDAELRDFQRGIHQAADRYGARVIGGNLSSGPLSITITAIGEGREKRLVRRSGARPGDALWVTGSPGLARLGLRCLESGLEKRLRAASAADRHGIEAAIRAFRRPTARVREALAIAGSWLPTAMIDLSDGLATDVGHVLDESSRRSGKHLGAELDLGPLLHDDGMTRTACRLRERLAGAALRGGEDYELCFTAAPRHAHERLAKAFHDRFGLAVRKIGCIVERHGIRVIQPDGSTRSAVERGWQHF